jgi:hypothetical protein
MTPGSLNPAGDKLSGREAGPRQRGVGGAQWRRAAAGKNGPCGRGADGTHEVGLR